MSSKHYHQNLKQEIYMGQKAVLTNYWSFYGLPNPQKSTSMKIHVVDCKDPFDEIIELLSNIEISQNFEDFKGKRPPETKSVIWKSSLRAIEKTVINIIKFILKKNLGLSKTTFPSKVDRVRCIKRLLEPAMKSLKQQDGVNEEVLAKLEEAELLK